MQYEWMRLNGLVLLYFRNYFTHFNEVTNNLFFGGENYVNDKI